MLQSEMTEVNKENCLLAAQNKVLVTESGPRKLDRTARNSTFDLENNTYNGYSNGSNFNFDAKREGYKGEE
jgi:hypothetical protein